MNFIKKKIKGPKKGLHADDDDFDPAFIPPTRVPEGAPKGWVPYEERIDEDSEEWLAFKKLTERVTETLQKTQDNLTKIVATSAVPEGTLEIKSAETNDDDAEFDSAFTDERKLSKSWINFEEDSSSFDSSTPPSLFATPSKSAKPPPRPPPPKHDGPPPRPSPPKLITEQFDAFEDLLGLESSTTNLSYNKTSSINTDQTTKKVDELLEFSLDDEFGFGSIKTNELITADSEIDVIPLNKDEKDPFDTSFIQVTSSEVYITKVNDLNTTTSLKSENNIELLSTEDFLSELSVNEDDPFVYPEDLGIIKTPTESSSDTKEKANMNISFPQYRAKSPNPFLNGSSSEMSSTNPFLTGSTLDQVGTGQSSKDSLNFFEEDKASVSSNPFVTHESKNELPDLFAMEDEFSSPPNNVKSAKTVDFLSDDLLSDHPSVKSDVSSNVAFDFFESTSTETKDIKPITSSREENIFDLPLTSTVSTSLFNSNSQNQDINNQSKSGQDIDLLGTMDSLDFFSSIPSTGTSAKVEQGPNDALLTDDFFSSIADTKPTVPPTFANDLFAEDTSVPATAPSIDKKEENDLKPEDDFDSFFESRRSSASGSISAKSSVVMPPVQTTVQPSTFDVFDSVSQPINAFDGLPLPIPKVKLEIPLELKQNAEVLEALGQKGPKTPIEPLNIFDLPTPVPGEENDFDLGITDLNYEQQVEMTASEEQTEMPNEPVEEQEDLNEEEQIHESPTALDKDSPVPIEITVVSENANDDLPVSIDTSFSALDQANFDAFEARFEKTTTLTGKSEEFDPFSAPESFLNNKPSSDTTSQGFGVIDEFDPFLTMTEPPAPPQPSPAKIQQKEEDSDSDDSGPDFSVFIRPRMRDKSDVSDIPEGPVPMLPPPPKSPLRSPAHIDPTPRFNPFDKGNEFSINEAASEFPELPLQIEAVDLQTTELKKEIQRTESQESAGTPLFEEDDSEPLEQFPSKYEGDGWELMLRQPNKKKITGQRFWKKVFIRLSDHVLHLFNSVEDKDPFQELPLQACYSLSEISAQQYDQYGKIFTVKLQYVFYRERVGVRPGQISKVTHGQITSFGQLAKLGLPLEHAPQVSQLLKIGTQTYNDVKTFAIEIEDALFRLTVHRDRALTYKTEEIQVSVQDETFADVSKTGHVNKQLARVRIFFLAFISGMPNVELGINDIERKGKEIVGRHDIIPVVTEEWIRLENVEFHSCILQEEFEKTRTIKLHPPDACFFELLRFRVRPPKNRELPLQVKVCMTISGNRVEIRCDILVPGFSSRKHGQIPCEDVAVRFPIPECWIYLFRVEKHFRYGSIKSAARKPGKIKGLERLMGTANTLDPSLIEVSTGQAKYEHQHHAIVWRVPRLPKEGQGAYTEHNFVCRLELTSYDQMPEELADFVHVEFTMPATTVSHTTVRSVSVSNPNPPEKHVRYISRHEYLVEINHLKGFAENEYLSATSTSGTTTTKETAQDSPASSTPS